MCKVLHMICTIQCYYYSVVKVNHDCCIIGTFHRYDYVLYIDISYVRKVNMSCIL